MQQFSMLPFPLSLLIALISGALFCPVESEAFAAVCIQADPASVRSSEQNDPRQDLDQAHDQKVEDVDPNFDLQIQLETFDYFWKTVADSHWDEALIEQKWHPLKEPNRQKVEQATSANEVRGILRGMIEELGLSHYSIIGKSAYSSLKEAEEGGDGTAGIEFRDIPEGIAVWRVRPDSPAAKAGIEPGWLVNRIGKLEMSDLIEDIRQAAKGPTRFETLVGLVVTEIASGEPGAPKEFVFIDREGEERSIELDFMITPGETTVFGNLPPIKVETTVQTIPDGIGYYWFNAFFNPMKVMPEFRQTIRDPNHSRGIIIDLRGNVGGIGAMTMGMASEFSNQQTALGVMQLKGNELKFFVNANIDPVKSPVAVLVDECSISSAEILSGGLQDLNLAKIFGSRTAGLALPSTIVKLPNGDGFQYAVANYISASGKVLEMDGVTPDEVITLNRDLLLNDPDPVLTRAIAWIKEQNGQ